MYEELVGDLRYCDGGDCNGCRRYTKDTRFCNTLLREAADAIEELSKRADEWETLAEGWRKGCKGLESRMPRWIPVTERLPKCEQEVLICTEKKILGKNSYLDSIVTPAIYEDGTMRENDSIWRWEDIDYAGWDEEEDCGIIPEGWWENRHFNPDEVYNNPVDRKVVAWMPLPEPPKEEAPTGPYDLLYEEGGPDA